MDAQQTLETISSYSAPLGFAAYPSGTHIPEVFRNAIREINKSQQVNLVSWEENKVEGKIVIDVVLDQIKRADFFVADLTGINPNVLFELGFAIARNKRIWVLIDKSITRAREDFQDLGLLTTVGYADYSNSAQQISKFFKAKPYEELASTLFDKHIKASLGGRDCTQWCAVSQEPLRHRAEHQDQQTHFGFQPPEDN
jgi:nucleoside 2-deoxyribosyltransferase